MAYVKNLKEHFFMLNYLKRRKKNDVIFSSYSCKLLSFSPDPTIMNVVLLIPERKKHFMT